MRMLASFSGVSQCTHSQDELYGFTAVHCVTQKGEALTLLPAAARLSETVPTLLVVARMDCVDSDFP